jgi:hypothetical protein
MSNVIRVAIVGLGETGEIFAEHLLEKIQINHRPVKIVAVADPDLSTPVALGFQQSGVPVYDSFLGIMQHHADIDIIFNLSGDPAISQRLRLELLHVKNQHATIASEEMAQLLWCFFDEGRELPKAEKRAFQISWKLAVGA